MLRQLTSSPDRAKRNPGAAWRIRRSAHLKSTAHLLEPNAFTGPLRADATLWRKTRCVSLPRSNDASAAVDAKDRGPSLPAKERGHEVVTLARQSRVGLCKQWEDI